MLRLLFSSRWLGYLALAVVFAAIASLLGLWQWDRRDQAVSAMDKVERNYDAPVAQLSEFLPPSVFTEDNEWRPVVMQGEYVVEEQILVRTRPRSGQVGFAILVPLRTQNATIIVDRGWIPTGSASDQPDRIPLPPEGTVSVTGHLKPGEPTLSGRGAPEGQLPSIDLSAMQELTASRIVEEFYVSLSTEDPSPQFTPLPLERPVLDEGPHLSYAFQWFVFALMGFFAYFWLLREEYRTEQGVEKKELRRPSDAEEEDALLEQRGTTPER